ncbi:Two-component response regulator-like [Ancistrocladus abbreviatus]
MTDEGEGNKGLVEINQHLCCERKRVENGTVGGRQGLLENGEARVNQIGQDIRDGNEGMVVQAAAVGQVPPQQPSQGAAVCWERFLPLRSLRVLLVENDDSTRHVVAALLRNCSYEVVEASNGIQAWKILEDITTRIDLVLTEVVMPYLSGIGLLCKIMSHKTRKNLPVIMMSSHDSMGLVFKCLSKGAVDFLVKPIRKNELKNLWQHVWRRCHSSSGSGSESGTQTQKSTRSGSADRSDNSGSNDGENNESSPLNFGDGSDHGSGTQSSWTKQAADDQVDSPRPVSPLNGIAERPDSTCAQVIHPNAVPSGNKVMNLTATHKCQEKKELPDANFALSEHTEMGKALETSPAKNSDLQLSFPVDFPMELKSTDQNSAPNIDSSEFNAQIDKGMMTINGENPSIELHSGLPMAIGVISDSTDPQRACRESAFTSKSTKNSETNESKELPSTEQSLKRLRGVQDVGKLVLDDRNVLRRSESSAFSRYNAASHNRISNSRSPSPLENGVDRKNDLMHNVQSHSGSNAPNQCSNGGSVYIDRTSISNNEVTETVGLGSKSAETSIPKNIHPSAFQHLKNDHVYSHQKIMLDKPDGVVAAKLFVQPRNTSQEFQHQHLHQLLDQNHLPVCTMPQQPVLMPHSGSSNIVGGPVEGNTGNYSLNGSASGSNHGSNGVNGCSTAAIPGGMNVESDYGMGSKSASGEAGGSGSGSGNRIDQSKLAQREAALTKFWQKRKERCFKRKVRYQSRKRLAEQRPRVRGQFVRQTPKESTSKDSDS